MTRGTRHKPLQRLLSGSINASVSVQGVEDSHGFTIRLGLQDHDLLLRAAERFAGGADSPYLNRTGGHTPRV